LSGTESSDGKSGEIHFSQQDVSSLLLPIATDNKFQGIDILITSQWPHGVYEIITYAISAYHN
jgi:hypothetical protein